MTKKIVILGGGPAGYVAALRAAQLGASVALVESREIDDPSYVANNTDRCFHCKDALFATMEQLRAERGFTYIAYGMNLDDTRDFRPGQRAAQQHHGSRHESATQDAVQIGDAGWRSNRLGLAQAAQRLGRVRSVRRGR